MIKLCLGIQPPQPQAPAYPMPYPVYQLQPVYITAQPKVSYKKWAYALPGIGMVALVISVFLPWLNLNLSASGINIDFSFNGIGSISGPAILTNNIKPTDMAKFTEQLNGWFLIGLVGVMVITILAGLSYRDPRSEAGSVLILFAFLTLGFNGYEYYQLQNFSNTSTSNLKAWYTSTLSSNAGVMQPGYGLIVAIMAGVFTLITSIIAYRFISD